MPLFLLPSIPSSFFNIFKEKVFIGDIDMYVNKLNKIGRMCTHSYIVEDVIVISPSYP